MNSVTGAGRKGAAERAERPPGRGEGEGQTRGRPVVVQSGDERRGPGHRRPGLGTSNRIRRKESRARAYRRAVHPRAGVFV